MSYKIVKTLLVVTCLNLCGQAFVYSQEDEKEKKPFPKVAVGLSVGIGIPVWFFFMFALWHSRKEKRKAEEIAKIPPPDYEAEMDKLGAWF